MNSKIVKRLYLRYKGLSSYPKIKQLDSSMQAELIAEAKKLKPNIKKWSFEKAQKYLSREQQNDIYESYRCIAQDYYDKIKDIRKQIEQTIFGISLEDYRLSSQRLDDWVEHYRCSASAYSTQGYADKTYAKREVERIAQYFTRQNIETRILSANEGRVFRLMAKLPEEYGWVVMTHPDNRRGPKYVGQWYKP